MICVQPIKRATYGDGVSSDNLIYQAPLTMFGLLVSTWFACNLSSVQPMATVSPVIIWYTKPHCPRMDYWWTSLGIQWMTGSSAPTAITERIKSNCSRSCIANGLKCTQMSRLQSCVNQIIGMEWMNECLTTLQHENRWAIGCQNKVDAWNCYQIKN